MAPRLSNIFIIIIHHAIEKAAIAGSPFLLQITV